MKPNRIVLFVRRRGSAALRRALFAGALLAVLCVGLLTPAAVQTQDAGPALLPSRGPLTPEEVRSGAGTLYEAGSVLVGVTGEGAAAAAASADQPATPLAAALSELQAEVVSVLDFGPLPEAAAAAAPEGAGALTADQTLLLMVPQGREWEAIERLAQTPGVVYAEPNGLVYAAQEEDPGAAAVEEAQTGPEHVYRVNDTLYEDEQWYLQRIHASRAWQAAALYRGTLPPVRVAVIDSGVDAGHPDLAGRVLDGRNYVSPGLPPADDFGHGTHVAGLIAAGTNDAIGMAGTAPFVQIDPYKALGSDGRGSVYDIAVAVGDATAAGARVINLSLQISFSYTTLQQAVQSADAQGVLLVAAGGNYPNGAGTLAVTYPAAYPEVIAVAATNYWEGRSVYSARGATVDIAAPGGDAPGGGIAIKVLSAWPSIPPAYNPCASLETTNGGNYCPQMGTSMSAGIVSGVAALVWAVNPSLTAQQVRQILIETATPLPLPAADVGAGRIDAHLAVRRALSPSFRGSEAPWMQATVQGAQPYSITMTLQNPSLQPLAYQVTIPRGVSWLRFPGGATANGVVRFGQPAPLAMTVDPAGLRAGVYSATVPVAGIAPNNRLIAWNADFTLRVGELAALHLPQVLLDTTPATTRPVQPVSSRWETPAAGARRLLTLTADGSQMVNLPGSFVLQIGGHTHRDIRVHADGAVSLPGSNGEVLDANRCLGDANSLNQAIFGWWADLDPADPAARLSVFAAGSDRFVVEYEDVPVEAGGAASFQIVLYSNGAIGLNYKRLPTAGGAASQATVGVEQRDGRFFNQLYCNDGSGSFGAPPRSGESFLINPGDVF